MMRKKGPALMRRAVEVVELTAALDEARGELDNWLMAHELPGDHGELGQCADRTRRLLDTIKAAKSGKD